MKKSFCLAAWLLMLGVLLTSLCACAYIRINDPYGNTQTGGSAVLDTSIQDGTVSDESITGDKIHTNYDSDGENALSALREGNFDASTLLIATTDTSHAFAQDAPGTYWRNQSVYAERLKRIALVEEKYNARIIFFTYTNDSLYDEIEKAFLSDTQYVSDYYAIPASLLGKFEASGFLMNLRTLPYTDYKQPYFDTAAMEEMSAGYEIYAAFGDFTRAYDELSAIYFNKDLAPADLYGVVEDGTWTWDQYFTYAKEATDEISGISGDNLGLLPLSDIESRMWGSADLHPIQTGLDKQPKLSTASAIPDTIQKMADLLYKNVYKKDTTLILSKDEKDDSGKTRFEESRSLFYHGDLSQMYAWADISVNWGILPLPTLGTEQKSYITPTSDSTVFCVPSTTVESDKSGLILQALFAASYNAYEDLYLSDALTYYIRDEKTADMLDIIVSSTRFDFSAMFASGYSEISDATVGVLHSAVTTKDDANTLFQKATGAAKRILSDTFYMDR